MRKKLQQKGTNTYSRIEQQMTSPRPRADSWASKYTPPREITEETTYHG